MRFGAKTLTNSVAVCRDGGFLRHSSDVKPKKTSKKMKTTKRQNNIIINDSISIHYMVLSVTVFTVARGTHKARHTDVTI